MLRVNRCARAKGCLCVSGHFGDYEGRENLNAMAMGMNMSGVVLVDDIRDTCGVNVNHCYSHVKSIGQGRMDPSMSG